MGPPDPIAAIPPDDAAINAPSIPAWITCGEFVLTRTGGDFPEEIVYSTVAGRLDLWIKSKHLLSGPWDWIVVEGGRPVDFQGPFATRDQATADLAAFLERTKLTAAGAEDPDLVSIVASSPHAPRSSSSTPAPAPPGWPNDVIDPEVVAAAIDLAIVMLRRTRSHLTARQGVNSPNGD